MTVTTGESGILSSLRYLRVAAAGSAVIVPVTARTRSLEAPFRSISYLDTHETRRRHRFMTSITWFRQTGLPLKAQEYP